MSWLAAWREQARTYCRRLLEPQPQPARSIFLALLLGDQTEISPPLRQAFNRTGATHVLSVSGMHLVIIAAFFAWVFFWLLRRSAWLLLRLNALKLAVFLSTLPVIAYVWLAEGSPATQRSAVMILAYMVLVLLDRHRDIYSALILAALLILVASPLQLYAISFQLSFLAVWGLAFLSPVLYAALEKLAGGQGGLVGLEEKTRSVAGGGLVGVVGGHSGYLAGHRRQFSSGPHLWHCGQYPGDAAHWRGRRDPGFSGPAPVLSASAAIFGAVVFSGRLVLDVSVYLMEQAAALPGVVMRLPAPTAWQTAAYFLLLISLFGASRRLWRWTGVSLGLLVLTGSLVWSGFSALNTSQLTITALDTPREMSLVATFPQGVVHGYQCRGSPLFRQFRQNQCCADFLSAYPATAPPGLPGRFDRHPGKRRHPPGPGPGV